MRVGRRQSGFTLIELMVVVLIVGLVSSIAIPVFTRAMQKASRMAAGASLLQVHDAMARYYTDNGQFPALNTTTFEPLVSGGYLDDPETLLNKLQGNKVWLYLNLGNAGWWLIAHPKGDTASLLYTGHVLLPSFSGSPLNYDGVFWYNPTETPQGLSRLDGRSIGS